MTKRQAPRNMADIPGSQSYSKRPLGIRHRSIKTFYQQEFLPSYKMPRDYTRQYVA
jgi:hypothetical protein